MIFVNRTWITRNFAWMLLILLFFTAPVIARAATSGVAPSSPVSATGAEKGAASGTITGTVADTSGAVLVGAHVGLLPTDMSVPTDNQGQFILAAVPAGHYTLTISYAGFQSYNKEIDLTAGQTLAISTTLTVSSTGEQVVVTAQSGHSEVQAITEEINSPNIVNVMPAAQIISLPNANVADAIGRLPGVTLQRDEGEGVYIQVRGLDPRLSNVTIDGVTIPSPEAAVRQVDLATIPADMVQSIELNKTLSANQDADGIGGSVNLVTKTAGERPSFTIESTIGETPIDNTRYMGETDMTAGKRFGAAKRLGVIMSASYDYNGRGINDIEPQPDFNPSDPTSLTPYYDNITMRLYRFQRLRWGGTMGADYKINDHSSLFAHFMLSDFKDWGDKWYYEVQTGDSPKFYESSRKPDFMIGTLSVGGNHIFNSWWLTWGSAVSRSRELNSGGNPKVTANPTSALSGATSGCNYDGGLNGNQYLPQWDAACMQPNTGTPSANVYDPANYNMKQFVITTGQAVQLNLQEWISTAKNYRIGTHSATLEFGGEFRNAHKFQNAYTPTYDAAKGINMAQFESGFLDKDYYGGNYAMGPVTSYPLLNAYFQQNFASKFTLDVDDTHFGSDPDNFNLIERVSAGYIMNTINWNKFRLQTGLRIEGTQTRSLGYVPNQDSGGDWISDTTVNTNSSYWDPLPSVQLRYAIDSRTYLRAVYARGISRPDPFDLVPYVIINDGSNPAIQVGNPSIKPTLANNFDVLFQHQFSTIGVVEGGYFFKQLSNPIFADFTVIPPTSPYYGISGNPVDIQQQDINGSGAHVSGLEIAWQQRFAGLPGGFSGLGINANYAYTYSDTEGIPGRTDTPALDGTARQTYNIQPSYEYSRYSAHMGISYNGPAIFAYQYVNNLPAGSGENVSGPINGPFGDNYSYAHLQIDAQVGAKLYRGLSIHVDGLNLTNEVFGFYNGSPQYVVQREYYKPTYSASLRWDLGSHE